MSSSGNFVLTIEDPRSDVGRNTVKYTFANPIDNSKYDMELGVISVSFPYLFNSIANECNSNKIAYRITALGEWKEITIPDGFYSVETLNTCIKTKIALNGDGVDNITISGDSATQKIVILLGGNYQLDLQSSRSDLHKILGYDSGIILGNETHVGNRTANMSSYNENEIVNIVFRCNITQGVSFSSSGIYDSIYTSKLLQLNFGDTAAETIPNVRFNKISVTKIKDIEVTLVSQDNFAIPLIGSPIMVELYFRRRT